MLSELQERIATTEAAIAAVFAGAGAGKTAVLVRRVQWLLDSGVPPENILVFTFTRKAAAEIKERIGNAAVTCDTFHAVCLNWLRENSSLAGFPYGLNGVLGEAEIKQCKEITGREFDSRHMADNQAASFDQLIELGAKILQENPGAVLPVGCHVIVDEAQDNSAQQWEITESIAAADECETLLVVGDFRQAIYEWRNASPETGMKFCSRGGIKQFYMSMNYRSGPEIIDISNRIIACGGFNEPMESADPNKESHVEFIETLDLHDTLTSRIYDLGEELVPYNDIAVLCRYNQDADAIAANLELENIPVCRPKPIDNEALSRFSSWASWQANRYNKLSWAAMVGKDIPATGKRSIITNASRGISDLWMATRDWLKENDSTGKMEKWSAIMKAPLKDRLEEKDGKAAWLGLGGSEHQWNDGIRNCVGLPFEEIPLSLFIDARQKPESSGVNVLTGHSAKGLQWDTVFVVGVEQRKTPGMKRGRKKEEERRLLYVQTTRAKRRLAYIITRGEEWSEFLVDEHGRFLI